MPVLDRSRSRRLWINEIDSEYTSLEARTRYRATLDAERAQLARQLRPYKLMAYAAALGIAGAYLLSLL